MNVPEFLAFCKERELFKKEGRDDSERNKFFLVEDPVTILSVEFEQDKANFIRYFCGEVCGEVCGEDVGDKDELGKKKKNRNKPRNFR